MALLRVCRMSAACLAALAARALPELLGKGAREKACAAVGVRLRGAAESAGAAAVPMRVDVPHTVACLALHAPSHALHARMPLSCHASVALCQARHAAVSNPARAHAPQYAGVPDGHPHSLAGHLWGQLWGQSTLWGYLTLLYHSRASFLLPPSRNLASLLPFLPPQLRWVCLKCL